MSAAWHESFGENFRNQNWEKVRNQKLHQWRLGNAGFSNGVEWLIRIPLGRAQWKLKSDDHLNKNQDPWFITRSFEIFFTQLKEKDFKSLKRLGNNSSHSETRKMSSAEILSQMFGCCTAEEVGPPRRKIDRSMIGNPTDFRHTAHVGTSDLMSDGVSSGSGSPLPGQGQSFLGQLTNQLNSKGGYYDLNSGQAGHIVNARNLDEVRRKWEEEALPERTPPWNYCLFFDSCKMGSVSELRRKSVWKWETVRDEDFGEISLPPPAIVVSITDKSGRWLSERSSEVKSWDLSSTTKTRKPSRAWNSDLFFVSLIRSGKQGRKMAIKWHYVYADGTEKVHFHGAHFFR